MTEALRNAKEHSRKQPGRRRRGPGISDHPKKEEIVKALQAGQSYRAIAERFGGLSIATLSRYMKGRPPVRVSKPQAQVHFEHEKMVIRLLEELVASDLKMKRSCEEYLQDPDNPSLYHLGPRDDEVMVACVQRDAGGTVVGRRKARLSRLLEKINGAGVEVVDWRWRTVDPRTVFLKISEVLTRELEAADKLLGEIVVKAEQVSIQDDPDWIKLQQIILEETADHPEVSENIARRIYEMGGEDEALEA